MALLDRVKRERERDKYVELNGGWGWFKELFDFDYLST